MTTMTGIIATHSLKSDVYDYLAKTVHVTCLCGTNALMEDEDAGSYETAWEWHAAHVAAALETAGYGQMETVTESEPYVMRCTDRNPDYCACGVDEDLECCVCGEDTEGYATLNIMRRANPFLPDDDENQSWEIYTRHKDCKEAEEES